MNYRLIIHVVLLLQLVWIVSGQSNDCPVEIDRALDTANEICVGTGRNQVCYGNNNVEITPYQDNVVDFDTPGDIAALEQIRTLSLSALDTENGQWGIALMRMLANLNPLESEDVTVLLFGDVEIEDASGQQLIVEGTANTYSNMRRYPNTESTVMDSVAINDTIHVTGRIEDGSWIRILNPATNIVGWMLASFVNNVDIESLPIVDASQPYFAPMQAFYFNSGTGTSVGCTTVPRDGIIIQTPEGLQRVTLWVNEVTIDFLTSGSGTTTSLQTAGDGSMMVNVLEGSVFVSNETEGYVAVAGSAVNVKVSDKGGSSSISPPIAIDPDLVGNMPLDNLDRDVEIPEPASDETIAEANGYADEPVEEDVASDSSDESSGNNDSSSGNGTNGGGSANGGRPDCPGNSCDSPGQNGNNDNSNSGNSGNNGNNGNNGNKGKKK